MITPLPWVSSEGGPLILIGARHLDDWEGIDAPSDGRVVQAEFRWNGQPDAPATDYDRTCDVWLNRHRLSWWKAVGGGHG